MTAGPDDGAKTERRGGFLRGVRDDTSPFGVGAILFWALVGVALGIALPEWLHWPDMPTTIVAVIGGVFGLAIGLYAAMGTSTLAHVLAAPGFLMELPF